MANKKRTSKNVASNAGEILNDPNSSEIKKKLAGSVLAQRDKDKQTGKKMEKIASKVLKSPKYSDETKKLAASLLSQSNKDR